MSEHPDQKDSEHEVHVEREPETGPLLPTWFLLSFYGIFGAFCIFAVSYIIYSFTVQHALTASLEAIRGDIDETLHWDSDQVQEAVEVMRKHPVDAFLHLNQELLQEEMKDGRMARALALEKARTWGLVSARRELVNHILSGMQEDGSVLPDFTLDSEQAALLEGMIAERRANREASYAEDLITDVLEWISDGHPGRPSGPEKRRIGALADSYAKKVFVGEEAAALEELALRWRDDPDAAAREASEAFGMMLIGGQTDLSPAASRLCAERAAQWEGEYRRGMVNVARAARSMISPILDRGLRLDHPHIYQYLILLQHRFDAVRDEVREGAWMMRHREYCVRFLGVFANRTAINPVMAVETVRLTKEEHERLMRRQNQRRLHEAVRLLGRIGSDYVRYPAEYEIRDVAEADAFMRKWVVYALEAVAEEEELKAEVAEALEEISQAEEQRPGPPILLLEAAEV
jgi:hypothetical protein